MYEINKIYRKHVKYELTQINEQYNLLNKEMIEAKVLSFLSELGHVGEESKAYTFYDNSKYDKDELISSYKLGLKMLLSIAFELNIDELKDVNEISNDTSINTKFIKIYSKALKLNQTYKSKDFQDLLEDYLDLGISLNLDMNVIFKTCE